MNVLPPGFKFGPPIEVGPAGHALTRFDSARRAVAECASFDELQDWEDKAAAVREYGRRIGHARIERLVEGPYLELYARRERTNWTTWGNELQFKGSCVGRADLDTPTFLRRNVEAVAEAAP